MRFVHAIVGGSILFFGLCFLVPESSVSAKGKSADKGLYQAIQKAAPQAQDKILIASQKGNYKGQSMQKGSGQQKGGLGMQKGGKGKR